MLTHLSISNYTIVSQLEVEYAAGMTVITGETGAGKSIMLDALGLCLGDRADPRAVRPGAERAEIAATFAIDDIPAAAAWLDSRDLGSGDECLLRRVITAEGRSRAYINGSPSTAQDCAELGALLIDIHSQHAHQSLLRRAVQRELLDEFGGHARLVQEVENTASDWLRAHRELELLAGNREEHGARTQLLTYQVEELEALGLQEGELEALEDEQRNLENAEDILVSANQALELCEEHAAGARRTLQLLDERTHGSAAAQSARELLDSAAIGLSEARGEIQRHLDRVEVNPERLREVQSRLESIYDVARKHRVLPEQVLETAQRLQEELDTLSGSAERVDALQAEMDQLASDYREQAGKLGKARAKAAKKLAVATQDVLASLSMAHCQLEIALTPREQDQPHPHGREEVELRISTNPGAAPQALGKIASGGELSRISLAIQVVAASSSTVPAMVFDEVDVGIGGAVAEVVGRLLRSLAQRAQVLCVTHLPQVAAQGHHHLRVSKSKRGKTLETQLESLDAEGKVEELARMLGGVNITAQTRAHAREMLDSAGA
ncbi:DNA repair protein RecN [Mangrovimicrobium sediminis]|uniref:DNA repair protein RecN n=1 Tax=Mangrovimicrobium sediminis TaxID=2562682 RepID=A0A4Z0M3F6_9GAMM|nr:DNA repair protein RecN [Haliea sp. SAOS-164]TGD74142.1 DNA repair protein RecN [Haliea sp. SAOS-164]